MKVLPTWKVGQSGSLSFRFATNERNGLLFYNGAGGSMASGPMGGGGGGSFGGAMGGGSMKDNGKVSSEYSDRRMILIIYAHQIEHRVGFFSVR